MKMSFHPSAGLAKASATGFVRGFASILLALAFLVGTAGATSYYFDVNGSTPGSGVVNNGVYNGTNTVGYWTTAATGSSPTVTLPTRAFVVFSAGSDAAGLTYTLTNNFGQVGSSSTPGGITVADGFVTLTGSGTFYGSAGQTVSTLAGTSLTLTNGTWDFYNNTVTFNAAASTTITMSQLANVTGRYGRVVKTGSGLMIIQQAASLRGITVNVNDGELRIQNGNALYTSGYSCIVTNNGGTLELDNNGGADITVANNPITINGTGYNNLGALANYSGNNSFNGLITLAGASSINNNASGTTFTLNPTFGTAVTGAYGLTFGGAGNIAVAGAIDSPITALTLNGSGTVIFTNGGGFGGSPAITVDAGATLDTSAIGGLSLASGQSLGGSGTVIGSITDSSGSQILPGGTGVGILTFSNNLTLAGGDTVQFNFPSSTTNGIVAVGGDLTPSSGTPTTINLATLPVNGLTPANYVLFQVYGNLNGAPADFTVTNPASRQTFTVSFNTASSPKQVLLNVSGSAAAQSLIWQGGQNGNSWDSSGTTLNWLNGASTVAFFTGDNISFTDAGSANQPIINDLVIPNSVTVTVNSPNSYAFTGPGGISGPGGLTMTGSGTLTLATTNIYTGNTLVAGGELIITDGGSVAGFISNNAAVAFDLAGTATFTNPVSGSGNLANTGGGNVTLTGSVSLGGTLSDSATGNLTLTGPLNVDASVTNSGGGTLTFGALAISGGGGLVNSGGGTVILTGTSSYTGGTVNTSGTIQVGNGSTGILGSGPIINNGTLVFNSSQNFVIADPISGSGALTQNGPGTVILTGTNSFSGLTTDSGMLIVSNSSTALGTGNVQVSTDGTLGLTGNITLTNAINVSGDSTTTYTPQIDNLNGTNTVTGLITGSSGGGNYNFDSDAGLLVMAGNYSNTIVGTAIRTVNLQGVAYGNWTGTINDSGTVMKVMKLGSGTWTLSGSNGYSGSTTVSNGNLLVNGVISSTNTVFVNANSTLGGSGTIAGPVTVNGTLEPGTLSTIGTLTCSFSVTLNGTNVMKLNKASSDASDILSVGGGLVYGGTLVVTNQSGTLTTSDAFLLFSTPGSGAFSNIVPAAPPGAGLAWNTNTLTTDGTLRIVSVVKPSPTITSISLSGTTLNLTVTNGATGGQYVLLQSTNLTLPLAQWTPVFTNTFDGNGILNLSTNIVNPAQPNMFYILLQ